MKLKELDRVGCFERLKTKELTQTEVSEILDLSLRQIKRLFKNFKLYGAISLGSVNKI